MVVGGVTLGLAAAASLLLLGLTAATLGERSRLAHVTGAPRLAARGIPLRAAGLFIASAIIFAGGESAIHWHAGYGFHPQHCLTGPSTQRDPDAGGAGHRRERRHRRR